MEKAFKYLACCLLMLFLSNLATNMATAAQYVLVKQNLGVNSALELSGALSCVAKETGDKDRIQHFFTSNNMAVELVEINKGKKIESLMNGRCDIVIGTPKELLKMIRASGKPNELRILQESID